MNTADSNKKRNDYYIYNLPQINWMLQQGCIPLEIGKGTSGNIFLRFPRTSRNEEIVGRWKLSKKLLKTDYSSVV